MIPMPSPAKVKKKKRYVERPDVRQKLLDAAETVVREEGYAAATVRRIASRAGMTHQAVFYYFGSQDEMLLALLRRSAESYYSRLSTVLSSETPLRGLWNLVIDQHSTRIGLEFMALANHNETIRVEIASNAKKIRALEAEAIQKHLASRGIEPRLSPELVSILTNALARLLVQEATLGILDGHAEAEALVDESLRNFEAWGEANTEVAPIVDAMASPT
jgi:TetR/AcrR family transcriptional regulator of autoinduction and epiphytic fitness